jgi:hypothetical protein
MTQFGLEIRIARDARTIGVERNVLWPSLLVGASWKRPVPFARLQDQKRMPSGGTFRRAIGGCWVRPVELRRRIVLG